MSLVPEGGEQPIGFEDIISGMTTTALRTAPMDGDLVYIDSLMGEESRRQLQKTCAEISGEMAVKADGLSRRQVEHTDKVLKKLMDAGNLPFFPGQRLAIDGAGVFLAYDLAAEVEFDIQVGILISNHRIFGHFAEVQYNEYPVITGLLDLPEDHEESLIIDGDENGYVVCLENVMLCRAENAGLKVESFDKINVPISENDFRFHTVYPCL